MVNRHEASPRQYLQATLKHERCRPEAPRRPPNAKITHSASGRTSGLHHKLPANTCNRMPPKANLPSAIHMFSRGSQGRMAGLVLARTVRRDICEQSAQGPPCHTCRTSPAHYAKGPKSTFELEARPIKERATISNECAREADSMSSYPEHRPPQQYMQGNALPTNTNMNTTTRNTRRKNRPHHAPQAKWACHVNGVMHLSSKAPPSRVASSALTEKRRHHCTNSEKTALRT